jgi:hypothetical protein
MAAVALQIPCLVSAQVIRGTVVADLAGTPLTGVSVSALPVDRDSVLAMTIADDGAFRLALPEAGAFRLRAELLGYATSTTGPVAVTRDEIVSVELRLRPDAIPLEPLRVVARRMEPWFMDEIRRRERQGFGKFVWREDLELRAGAGLRDVLWTVPGLRVPLIAPGVPAVETRSAAYSLGTCYAALYVNGTRHFDHSTLDEPYRLKDFFAISPAEIEAIEVYRGAAEVPAEYSGSTAECGVVAIWLRTGASYFSVAHDQVMAGGTAPRVRLAVTAGSYRFSGRHSPERALAVDASAYWRIGRTFSVGLHMRHSAPRLPMEAAAELARGLDDSFVIPSDRHPSTLFVAGIGPRLRLFPERIMGPVLDGRVELARRRFRLDQLRIDRDISFTSYGWGASGSAGLEVTLSDRLAAQVSITREWLSFGKYATLETRSKQTAATWNGTGLRFGIGYEL